MGGPSRIVESLRAAREKQVSREFASDIFEPEEPLIPEEELDQRRSELKNGPTDMQRLFLFAKLIKFLSRQSYFAVTPAYAFPVLRMRRTKLA